MFMSMEKTSRDAAPEPWRGARSLARPAAAAFVWRRGGGSGSAAAAGDQPQRRVLGTGRERSARGPLFPPPAGRAAARSSAAAGQRRPGPGSRGAGGGAAGAGRPPLPRGAQRGRQQRSVTRCAQRDRPSAPLRPGSAALPRLGCRWRGSLAASARGAPRMPRETAREHLTWADKGAGPRRAARGSRTGTAGARRGSAHRSALAERNGLSLSRQNKKCNQRIESAPTLPLHSGIVSGGSLPSPRLMEFTHKEKKNRRGEKGPSSYCRGWEGDKRKAIRDN